MTELQQYKNNDVARTSSFQPVQLDQLQTPQGVVDLASWAHEMQAAYQIAESLCQTSFVPKDFLNKPGETAAAILTGKALGMDPLNSVANIFVVHGRPALYARTMVALVLDHGHELIRAEATPKSVTYMARRKGQDEWQEFTWTIDRAKQAGYTSNKKYQTDPIAMLTAKAQAEACRTIAPDVLTGVASHSVEEHELEGGMERPARPSRVARAVEAPSMEQEPAFEGISKQQWDEILAAGKQHGLAPAQVGALASDTLGYDMTGWKDVPADQYDAIMTAIHNVGTPEEAAQGAVQEFVNE